MRDLIAKAIVDRFETTYRDHGISFDPDTCYEAADDVLAVLASELLSQPVEARRGAFIGPAVFHVRPERDA